MKKYSEVVHLKFKDGQRKKALRQKAAPLSLEEPSSTASGISAARDPMVGYDGKFCTIIQMELEEQARRHEQRSRYDRLRSLVDLDILHDFLRRRRGVDPLDQRIARMVFDFDVMSKEEVARVRQVAGAPRYAVFLKPLQKSWHITIRGEKYPARIYTAYLPAEIAAELGITISKIDAAIVRILRETMGATEEQLIAEDEAEREAKEARLAQIPVPEPALPRRLQRCLRDTGQEPSWWHAVNVVSVYCEVFRRDLGLGGWGSPDDDLHAAKLVDEHVRDLRRTGPDYAAIRKCAAIIRKTGGVPPKTTF